MIGNHTFSKLCSKAVHPNFPALSLSGGPMHPIPMLDTALQCLKSRPTHPWLLTTVSNVTQSS